MDNMKKYDLYKALIWFNLVIDYSMVAVGMLKAYK